MEFLFLLDFGVVVSSRVFESYCSHLEKEMMINGASQRIERAIVPNAVDDVTELSVEDTQSSSPPQGMDWPELLCLHFLFIGLVILVTLGILSWTTFLFLQFLVLDMLEAQTAGSALGSDVKDSLLNFPPPLHCSDFGLYGPTRELCVGKEGNNLGANCLSDLISKDRMKIANQSISTFKAVNIKYPNHAHANA